MYVHEGVGHFVTYADEMNALEPVIVHETAHQLVSHLPLPAWLNEGLAVNTECRLGYGAVHLQEAVRLSSLHRAHWTQSALDAFWSGESFAAPGESTPLSYDLARLLVGHLAGNWPKFVEFANLATSDDAGRTAFRDIHGAELDEVVLAVIP
jgi:hypothetical protein